MAPYSRKSSDPRATARRLLIAAPQIRSMVTQFLRMNQNELRINIQEFDLMRFCEGRDSRMVDLADRMSVTPSAVTKIVDGLHAKGLIARRDDRRDRRVVRVRLTGAGSSALRRVRAAASEYLSGLIEDLDDDARASLDAGLEALITAIDRRNERPSGQGG